MPDKQKKPRDYVTHPLGDTATKEEISEFLATLRAEYAKTENTAEFFEKYRRYYNCYAYASGSVSNPYAMEGYDAPFMTRSIPGGAAGAPMRFITAEELDRAVVADGYTRVVPPNVTDPAEKLKLNQKAASEVRKGYTLVAAFIDDRGGSQDFHFAVRDSGKLWSQKFGSGKVEYEDFDDSRIDPPHLNKNVFQNTDIVSQKEHNKRFVGYYWRPEKGLYVEGAACPAVGVKIAGTNDYSHNVWLSASGTVRAAKEVRGWSLKTEKNGDFKLGLQHDGNDTTFITLPKSLLTTLDGVTHIYFSDPSGPGTALEVQPNGKVKQRAWEYLDAKRPSPFR